MKNLTLILIIIAAISFASCEGPMGPPGYDGVDGLDGESLIGTVFETDYVTFNEGNEYSLTYYFEEDFEIYDTDIVLVYMLWGLDSGKDVWRLLPQTLPYDEGIIQYNFDYTFTDVQVFMEGTIAPEDWLPEETDDKIFRIVVLPAGMLSKKSVDVFDYNSILNSSEISLKTIKNVEFGKIDSISGVQIEK